MVGREAIQDVNIELGDQVSEWLYDASKTTYSNRPGMLEEMHESFSGLRAIPGSYLKDLQNLYFNLGFDGVGTKVEIAERIRDHSTVAFDLFAMVCDDAVVRGAEPIAIGSILDVKHLNDNEYTRRSVSQLAEGYVAAAAEAGVAVVNGEVAELGDRIGGFETLDNYGPVTRFLLRLSQHLPEPPGPGARWPKFEDFTYNWGAAVLWVAHKDRMLTGHQIQPGDLLIGLPENGFRSNGITDVRKAMRKEYGRAWHDEVWGPTGETLGEVVRRPSTIYSKFVTELTGGFDIEKEQKAEVTGIAHVTGGGLPSKVGRMLEPSGLGVRMDSPLPAPDIMTHVQELRGFDDKTSYGKWHMGQGMVLAVRPESEEATHEEARSFGLISKTIGSVTTDPLLVIKSVGAQTPGEILAWELGTKV